ncbi:MAG: response regulator [Bacteroidales bacterium]|nr:response regulator [Bacteroidales bacterium]
MKKLLQLMGGDIRVESETGRGATFIFHLPFENKGNMKSAPESENTNISFNVLLVEDDPSSVVYYEEIFDDGGITWKLANTGEKAIELFKSLKFDVILLDLRLPDINGLEIAKRIREADSTVTIIAQTAYAMIEDEVEALQAGCNDFISKPIRPALLLEKIRKQVSG